MYSLRAESSDRLQTEQVVKDELFGIRDHQHDQLLCQLGTLVGIRRGVGLQELHQDLGGQSGRETRGGRRGEGDEGRETRCK